MGNQNSSGNRMAISAMAHMMKLTRSKLLTLRDHCIAVSDEGDTVSGYQISRAKFLASVGVVKLPNEPDYEVLEKLLVLWDKNGSGYVDPVRSYTELMRTCYPVTDKMMPTHYTCCVKLLFLAGVSPLASVMDVTTKLRLAFEVFDYEETGTISRDDMESVIGG